MALKVLSEQATIDICDADLVNDGDAETFYTVRVIPAYVMDRLRKEAARKRPTGRFTSEDVDSEKMTRMVIDYMLVSWRGVVDEHGDPMPPDQTINTSAGPMAAKYFAIDQSRYAGLLERATRNEVISAERREQSFRGAQ